MLTSHIPYHQINELWMHHEALVSASNSNELGAYRLGKTPGQGNG